MSAPTAPGAAGRAVRPGQVPRQEQEAGAPRPSLQVLERAFAILEAFTEFRSEWSTSDLARFLELPIPTVHRLLGALARLGYVSRDEQTRRFRLGGAAMHLGERARAVSDLRTVAILPLRRLSEATDETAILMVLNRERDRCMCLDWVETSQALRLSVQPGSQLPLHAGACQKALLAFMPEREVERLLALPLERLCAATITEPQQLRRDLEMIRERGWASSYEEVNIGVRGIAVPVISSGDVVCAVGIGGPSARLSDEGLRRDVPSVQRAALAVARSLGLAVPPVTLPGGRAVPRPHRRRQQREGGTRASRGHWRGRCPPRTLPARPGCAGTPSASGTRLPSGPCAA